MNKILFIGDVFGRSGRKILREVLPQWKEQYQPDTVIVNVENLAHGKGVTPVTLAEVAELGVDCFTSGNHIFKKGSLSKESLEKYPQLIRPANFSGQFPGYGYYRFSKNGQQFLVINLNGQVFMENQFDGEISNPFLEVDKILTQEAQKGDIIVVDFHAEATSEKVAFGYFVDGRVSAVFGTHTHVPTADARILSKGTAYLTDAGMTGALEGVIGVVKENVLQKFLNPASKFVNQPAEDGELQINGVLVEVGESQKAVSIKQLRTVLPS